MAAFDGSEEDAKAHWPAGTGGDAACCGCQGRVCPCPKRPQSLVVHLCWTLSPGFASTLTLMQPEKVRTAHGCHPRQILLTTPPMTHQALQLIIHVIRHFHLPRPLHLIQANHAVKDLDRACRMQDSTINALAQPVQRNDPLAIWRALCLDFKAAHKRMRVKASEHGTLLFRVAGLLCFYKVCHFGARFSSYWWGRAAASSPASCMHCSMTARTPHGSTWMTFSACCGTLRPTSKLASTTHPWSWKKFLCLSRRAVN